jgi:hypothetical protein
MVTRTEVDEFLVKTRGSAALPSGAGNRGRLIFALDATASRQPTWDIACKLQAEMFREVAAIGGLDIQLVYYRGDDECRASRWISDAKALTKVMTKIMCEAGHTQIGKVLAHARRENKLHEVHALVFVGDAMEEMAEDLYSASSALGIPTFLFQEDNDRDVGKVFRKIASLTKGAHCNFNSGSASELAELLRAVAVYATGGMQALNKLTARPAVVKLIAQLK